MLSSPESKDGRGRASSLINPRRPQEASGGGLETAVQTVGELVGLNSTLPVDGMVSVARAVVVDTLVDIEVMILEIDTLTAAVVIVLLF